MQKRKPLVGKTSSSWQGGLDLVQNDNLFLQNSKKKIITIHTRTRLKCRFFPVDDCSWRYTSLNRIWIPRNNCVTQWVSIGFGLYTITMWRSYWFWPPDTDCICKFTWPLSLFWLIIKLNYYYDIGDEECIWAYQLFFFEKSASVAFFWIFQAASLILFLTLM